MLNLIDSTFDFVNYNPGHKEWLHQTIIIPLLQMSKPAELVELINVISEQSDPPTDLPLEQFIVSFTDLALELIKNISSLLVIHEWFISVMSNYAPLEVPLLHQDFEKRYAMFVALTIQQFCKSQLSNASSYAVAYNDVMFCTNTFLTNTLYNLFALFPFNNTDLGIRDNYPLLLLCRVCGTGDRIENIVDAHVIGEAVKTLIEIRSKAGYKLRGSNPLPNELLHTSIHPLPNRLIDVSCGLANELPLTREELGALKRYLGTKRNVYVHILLNTLYEITRPEMRMTISNCTTLPIKQIELMCKSSWFCLFMMAAKYKWTNLIASS
jgi:hypothetical protein